MIGREVLTVPRIAQEVFIALQDADRDRRRVAIFAVRGDVLGFGLRLDAIQDLAYRHAGPRVAQPAPTCDAVDVRHHVLRRQRAKLAVVERQLMLDRAEHLEVPLRDVRGRYRSEMQEGPAVGSCEGLAGRNARRIDTLRESFALEQKRHLASIGTEGRRRLFRPRDPIRARLYWPFPQLLEHVGP